MAKNTPAFDDEIDLIELVQFFITHKTKYILLGLIGLILGLTYSFQHEPRFETGFKIHFAHPAFSNGFLTNSSTVQILLDESELNEKLLPHYSFNSKTKLFTVKTSIEDPSQLVSDIFTNAIKREVAKLKSIASSFEGFDNKPVILNNNNNNLTWSNKDISQLDPDEVIQYLNISFSQSKALYPNPLKHGVVGLFVGLVLTFVWMITSVLVVNLRQRS